MFLFGFSQVLMEERQKQTKTKKERSVETFTQSLWESETKLWNWNMASPKYYVMHI